MQKCIDLTDKVAIVTGGSSGIGWATAFALAKAGARVSINYLRNEAGAEDVRNSIVKNGGTAITVRADVTQSGDVEALLKRTTQELGPVDILINNAGSLVQRLRILELTEERWDEVIDLNLKSVFLCSRAVAASMMERKKGTIINVSSIAGRTGGALGSLHYSAAKAGVIALTKGLAKELGPFGVRVNAVSLE
jgi:3-oxoacyl-[acyl-carrier protein] reductase